MSWKYVDDLLLKFSKNSTFWGKFWILSILLFRLLVLTAFGEHIWSDEQREFTCNTRQPGCENVCFNVFTPVSNVRLWGLQMLAVSIPGAFYFLYVLHVISRSKILPSQTDRAKKSNDKTASFHEKSSSHEGMEPKGAKKRWKLLSGHVIPPEIIKSRIRCIWRLYFFQIILRIAMECVFSLLQYKVYFYSWTVPEVFACSRWPCPHTVDCFISRPHEKTVFFRYMFAVSGLSVLLSLAEVLYIFWTRARHKSKEKRKSNLERSCYSFATPAKVYLPEVDKFGTLDNISRMPHRYVKGKSECSSLENSSILTTEENENNSNENDNNRVSYL